MVYVSLYDKLWLKIDSDDIKMFEKIRDHFSYYVDGYFFMPKYKSGVWDGKIHLFKDSKLPYGLLFELIKFLNKQKEEVKLSQEVKNLFGQNEINSYRLNNDLKFEPRSYQNEIVKICLEMRKGIFVSPTASGKSFSIALIIDNINKNYGIKKTLIIVPNTSLILQFYDDLIDYGINKELLGKFYADEKDWDKPILISTWQSLSYDNEKIRKTEIKNLKKEIAKKSNTKEEREKAKERLDFIRSKEYIENVKELMETRQNLLDEVDCFFVDECQILKSDQLSLLVQKMKNADWRYACTGTLPKSRIDSANIISYIGPVIKRYTVKELTKLGYLNECLIKQYKINYAQKISGSLNEIKDQLFVNLYRQSIINGIVEENEEENILFLVNRIEKEGIVLENQLRNRFPDYQIKYIQGKVKGEEREIWRKKCNEEKKVILIANYSLFQAGINIPNLSRIVLVSSFKGEVRILQSIGRSLRKPENKKSSIIYDLCDQVKYLKSHGKTRLGIYEEEEYEVEEIVFKE